MNENQDNSRRRIAEIKMLSQQIDAGCVTKWLSRTFEKCEDKNKQKALKVCTDALIKDITDKAFGLCGFYKILNHNRAFFTEKEQICLIQDAETIIRDAIKIEELTSRERVFEAETRYIAGQGYVLNERYLISYPNNPEIQPEERVITEFRIYGAGEIHPVHGCKIKKDGSPYARAECINRIWNVEFKMTKI